MTAQRISTTTYPADYSFVNWVRMVAMFSIVAIHSLIFPDTSVSPDLARPYQSISSHQTTAYYVLTQFLRFGSIHFFLVAGFLVGKQADTHSPATYYRRRLRVIALPYLIAFGLYWLKSVVYTLMMRPDYNTLADFVGLCLYKARLLMFTTAYWFVPNYLLGLGVLLLFRRYLDQLWFGLIWLSTAVLYGINLHVGWLRVDSSWLFVSYTFYIWLGAWLARHPNILPALWRLSSGWWLLITVGCYVVAFWEGSTLAQQGVADPFHSLRIPNQLFALALFVLLSKVNLMGVFNWMNPRQESFGIYLYHMFFVALSARLAQHVAAWPFRYDAEASGVAMVALMLTQTVLIYMLTLLCVKLVNRTLFAWLLGNRHGRSGTPDGRVASR